MTYTIKELRIMLADPLSNAFNRKIVEDLCDRVEALEKDLKYFMPTKPAMITCSECGEKATHQCGFTSNEVCTTWLCEVHQHYHPIDI